MPPSPFAELRGVSVFTRAEAWVLKWDRGPELNVAFLALQLSCRVRGGPQHPPPLPYAAPRVISLVLYSTGCLGRTRQKVLVCQSLLLLNSSSQQVVQL